MLGAAAGGDEADGFADETGVSADETDASVGDGADPDEP